MELVQAEKMQKMIKKQQALNNLEETERLRELVEIEMTRVALQNELNMNRKYGGTG